VAKIQKIRVKTASFDELLDQACVSQEYSPHLWVDKASGVVDGVQLGLKIRVRTPEGILPTDGFFFTVAPTLKVQTEGGIVHGTHTHKMWMENGNWVPLSEMKIGDRIRSEHGLCAVTGIEDGGEIPVGDVCVPGLHAYYNENGLVSHNSLTANAIAINMATMGYKVLLVPLEMSKKEMTSRTLSNITKFNVSDIILQRLATNERDLVFKRYKRWAKKVKDAGGRYTIFKPQEDMTIEDHRLHLVAEGYGRRRYVESAGWCGPIC
jgi:hypothetical protein